MQDGAAAIFDVTPVALDLFSASRPLCAAPLQAGPSSSQAPHSAPRPACASAEMLPHDYPWGPHAPAAAFVVLLPPCRHCRQAPPTSDGAPRANCSICAAWYPRPAAPAAPVKGAFACAQCAVAAPPAVAAAAAAAKCRIVLRAVDSPSGAVLVVIPALAVVAGAASSVDAPPVGPRVAAVIGRRIRALFGSLAGSGPGALRGGGGGAGDAGGEAVVRRVVGGWREWTDVSAASGCWAGPAGRVAPPLSFALSWRPHASTVGSAAHVAHHEDTSSSAAPAIGACAADRAMLAAAAAAAPRLGWTTVPMRLADLLACAPRVPMGTPASDTSTRVLDPRVFAVMLVGSLPPKRRVATPPDGATVLCPPRDVRDAVAAQLVLRGDAIAVGGDLPSALNAACSQWGAMGTLQTSTVAAHYGRVVGVVTAPLVAATVALSDDRSGATTAAHVVHAADRAAVFAPRGVVWLRDCVVVVGSHLAVLGVPWAADA